MRSAYVSLLQDRRALVERGQRAWIGLSYLDDDVFLEPLEVGILRLIARDLELSGWARRARLGARDRFTDEDLLFGVTLEAGSSSFTEGLADLALVLPTSAGKARVAFRITVTDRDGRRWGELTIDEMIEGRSSPVAGAQQQALERLLTATRAALDAMILELEKVGDPRPR